MRAVRRGRGCTHGVLALPNRSRRLHPPRAPVARRRLRRPTGDGAVGSGLARDVGRRGSGAQATRGLADSPCSICRRRGRSRRTAGERALPGTPGLVAPTGGTLGTAPCGRPRCDRPRVRGGTEGRAIKACRGHGHRRAGIIHLMRPPRLQTGPGHTCGGARRGSDANGSAGPTPADAVRATSPRARKRARN